MSSRLVKIVRREGSGPLSIVGYEDGAKVQDAIETQSPAEALLQAADFLGVADQVTILNEEGEAPTAPEEEPATPEEELDDSAEDSEEEDSEETTEDEESTEDEDEESSEEDEDESEDDEDDESEEEDED